MNRAVLGLALASALLAAPMGLAQEQAGGTIHVTAGAVHTGKGEVFAPGAVTIVDGRITAVGPADRVTAPEGARVLDGGPFSTVIPGLVVAGTEHLAKGGDDPASVSPDVRALDGYDFLADETRALAGGVTTVFIAPGVRRVVSGRAAVVKTAGLGVAHRTLRPDAGLVAGIGDAVNRPPARIEPPDLPDATNHPLLPHRDQLPITRAGSLLMLRDLLARGREGDTVVEDVAKGQATLWLGADSHGDLDAALELVAETGVKAVFVGALDAPAVSDGLSKSGIAVVLRWPDLPGRVHASGDADTERRRTAARSNAARLSDAGVPFALVPPDEGSLADTLYVCASAVRAGLDAEQALAAVTSSAATILGVGDRVGSIEAGKDGDLVLLSGAPTDLRSFVRVTVADGHVVYERPTDGVTVVVRAAEVHVGDGRVFAPGEVAFEDGRIVEVGTAVGVPPGARFVDLGAGAVVPGFIDAFSHAGLAGEGGSVDRDLPTAVTAASALDLDDKSFELLRREGITTILAAPGGNGRVAGRAAVVKTGGASKTRVVREDGGLVVRLRGETDLGGAVKQLGGMLKRAKDYRAALEKYEKDKKEYDDWKKKQDAEKAKAEAAADAKPKADAGKPKADAGESKADEGEKKKDAKKKDGGAPAEEGKGGKKKGGGKKAAKKKKDEEKKEPVKPGVDETLAGYLDALKGDVPVFVRASTVAEVRAALKLLVDEWKLKVVVVGGDEARRVSAELIKAKAGVIASPQVLATENGRPVNLLREISLAGVPAAVGSDAYVGGAELLELLAYAVSRGLSPTTAVRMATGDAARVLDVADRVGTLQQGRDADLLLLSGPPFAPGSRLVNVFVGGEEVGLAD